MGDMMNCPGGDDGNGCEMPEFCISSIGEHVKDGNECPVTCPQKCSHEEMPCWGGKDANDCTMPDYCIPMKGGPLDKDGMECSVQCPVQCHADDVYCPSGHDFNGCVVLGNCMPTDLSVQNNKTIGFTLE